MFDIGWSELVVIGVVALIVIGPKELPGVLRMVGQWTAKVRRMAAEFQGQFNEALREAEIADLKKQVEEINETARSITHFKPLAGQSSKPAPEPGKPVEIVDAGESALVEAAASPPALPAVNDTAGAAPAEPPPAAGGAELSAERVPPEPTQPVPPGATAPVDSGATSPVAPAHAGAPSTEPRPAP